MKPLQIDLKYHLSTLLIFLAYHSALLLLLTFQEKNLWVRQTNLVKQVRPYRGLCNDRCSGKMMAAYPPPKLGIIREFLSGSDEIQLKARVLRKPASTPPQAQSNFHRTLEEALSSASANEHSSRDSQVELTLLQQTRAAKELTEKIPVRGPHFRCGITDMLFTTEYEYYGVLSTCWVI